MANTFVPTIFTTDAGIGRGDQPATDTGGSVTALHPQYEDFFNIWRKCRDAIDGEDAVKEKGEMYLPKMKGMDVNDYEAYKMRAVFYGATGRTVAGLLGQIFRKDPWSEYPDSLKELVDNITQTGKDLKTFARDVVNEQLSVGRIGVLTDMSPTGDGVPYLRVYTAENITNWRELVINGVPKLDQIILREVVETIPTSGFGSDFVEQFRVLEIDPATGFYKQRLFQMEVTIDPNTKSEKTSWEQVGDDIVPTRRGQPLDYIPFVVISADDLDPGVEKPPLLDLVNVNISHYRSSADLEHGRHFTALPTPYVTGVDQPSSGADDEGDVGELFIGSGRAWVLPMDATAGMLEFHGQGLKHLENALVEKQEQMVNLGARMLETSKRASETAESLRLRQSGDVSMLSAIVETAEEGIERAFRWAAWWMEVEPEEVDFELNKEFFEIKMDPQELNALVKSWQEGALSFPDLYENLVRGEVISRDRDIEEVKKDLLEDQAMRVSNAQEMADIQTEGALKVAAQKETVRNKPADGSPRVPSGGLPGAGSGNA